MARKRRLTHRRCLSQQLPDNPRRCLERRVDLGLVLAAGFGDLRLAAAGSADQLGDSANQLPGLDALGEAGRDSGDKGDLALRLRRGQYNHALAQLLLEVIDERAKLAALQRVGAQRYQAHALHFDATAHGLVQSAGGRLHARLFQFAAQALELVFLRGQLGAEGL